ncbi:MAG: TPM domain-containing protein [Clostridia bacterium]|nr:TPM domain-containing protein [Clostridia bacterium]
MVKRLCALMLALLLLTSLSAALAAPLVNDEAGLYTESEISQMEQLITRMRNKYQVDVTVLTTRRVPTGGTQTTVSFADAYYEDNGYGLGKDRAGVVFVVDMNNRFNYLSTAGVMIDYLNDHRVESILTSADSYLSYGRYGSAMIAELNATERYLAQGIEEGSFRYDSVTGERLSGLYNALTRSEMLVATAAGLAVALIMIFSVRGSYQLKGSTYRYALQDNSQRQLRVDTETFLRETVSKRRITQDHPSGGSRPSGGHSSGHGSSVHISSGGMSHGGGGHHF